MIAVESNNRLCGLTLRERAYAVVTPPTPRLDRDTAGTPRRHDLLANAVRWAGRVLERRRLAEIAWQKRPLSLDDAWAGGWYARSRSLQQALVQHDRRAHAAPASSTQDWDDRLD